MAIMYIGYFLDTDRKWNYLQRKYYLWNVKTGQQEKIKMSIYDWSSAQHVMPISNFFVALISPFLCLCLVFYFYF